MARGHEEFLDFKASIRMSPQKCENGEQKLVMNLTSIIPSHNNLLLLLGQVVVHTKTNRTLFAVGLVIRLYVTCVFPKIQ